MNGKTIRVCLLTTAFAALPLSVWAQEPSSMPTSAGGNPLSDTQSRPTSQTSPGVNRANPTPYASETQNGSAGNDAMAARDKMFLRHAAEGGLAEVKLGGLAAQKGSTDEVKKFGQKMVDDHTALNETMKPFAESFGVMTPAKMNKMDQAEFDKLSGLSGLDFDKEYLAFMSADHHKDLHDFRLEAASTPDATLKEAVMNGAKVIAQHTRMVDRLAAADGLPVPVHKPKAN